MREFRTDAVIAAEADAGTGRSGTGIVVARLTCLAFFRQAVMAIAASILARSSAEGGACAGGAISPAWGHGSVPSPALYAYPYSSPDRSQRIKAVWAPCSWISSPTSACNCVEISAMRSMARGNQSRQRRDDPAVLMPWRSDAARKPIFFFKGALRPYHAGRTSLGLAADMSRGGQMCIGPIMYAHRMT